MPASYFYQPSQGHRLAHDPFNAIVAPRPIGWISSQSAAGELNLAPYSFFNAFNYTPPLIGFASTSYKDTVSNLEATGEFCWNLVTRELAEAMNTTSASVAAEVDEFALAELTARPSTVIGVPHVAEARVAFECRVADIHQLRGADGNPAQSWLSIGEVVGVHIDPELITDGVYQTSKAHPVVRGGGAGDYFEITEVARFVMTRPS